MLSQLWSKYAPYWPAFVIALVICTGCAWIYLHRTTPLYQASATLLIKDQTKGSDDSKMVESLNPLSSKKIVENEIEVLISRSLMGEVVNRLRLYAPVFSDTRFGKSSAYSTTPVYIEVQDPTALQPVEKVMFQVDTTLSIITINEVKYAVNQWVPTPFGKLKFIPSKGNKFNRTGKFYFSLRDPEFVTAGLISRLSVSPSSKLSTVIDLKMREEDPDMSEDILDELILAYNRASVTEQNALASNTLDFVQERLDVVGKDLDSIERKIQRYKSSRGAVDISSQGRLFLENVSQNDQKVSDVNIQLAVLGQVEKYVKAKNNNEGIVPSTLGVRDPMLGELVNKLYESELERERLRKTTGENSSVMQALNDQIDKIKPGILENINNQRLGLEASRSNLSSTSNMYSSMLQSIPEKERDLVELSRQQNIESGIYTFLLQKREEAALSNTLTATENRVVDKAQASSIPVSPNNKLIYLVSIIGAMGLTISLITAREMFNRSILYRTEIEELTGLPIIGEIGFEKSTNPIVIGEGNNTLLGEQFRRLRASLGFIGIGHARKKILVTSTIPGEGKSFIAANLGLTLALTGKKVILVEADLSNPAMSAKLNITGSTGLSAYLQGSADHTQIIQQTAANPNLHIIPSGELPVNPSELLMNGKMQALLNQLETIYDYVIIDTAPVGALSDAYMLAPLCDATLYIVRHGHTPKLAVERLDKNNEINELKNGAIIFNAVKSRGFGNASYGHGYGYNYVYKREGKLLTK